MKYNMRWKIEVAALLALLLCGCHSSTLTRSRAKDVIESSDLYKLKKRSVRLTETEYTGLWRAGYLQVRGPGGLPERLEVGPKGKGLIDSAYMLPGGINPSIALSTPIKPYVVEVTGITDGENGSKIVEYKWNWDFSSQPAELQPFFKEHPVGADKATLRLYDDGWRAGWEKKQRMF